MTLKVLTVWSSVFFSSLVSLHTHTHTHTHTPVSCLHTIAHIVPSAWNAILS